MREDDNLMHFHLDSRMKLFGNIACFAIILLIIGILISVGIRGFGPREDTEYSSGDLEDWARKTNYVGAMIFYIGVGTLSFSMLTIAFFAKRMHLYMRIGLIVGAALLLGPTLNASYYLIGFN